MIGEMPVEALTQFPRSFVAGDTVRVTISDGDYPSSLWTLAVRFVGVAAFSFSASATSGEQFEIVLSAAQSLTITPGNYNVVFTYTETASGEKQSVAIGQTHVYSDPSGVAPISQARQTLNAMNVALLALAAGTTSTVNFNGQSFTKKNLKELQDAIAIQQGIVNSEDASGDLIAGKTRSRGIGVRFGNP